MNALKLGLAALALLIIPLSSDARGPRHQQNVPQNDGRGQFQNCPVGLGNGAGQGYGRQRNRFFQQSGECDPQYCPNNGEGRRNRRGQGRGQCRQ